MASLSLIVVKLTDFRYHERPRRECLNRLRAVGRARASTRPTAQRRQPALGGPGWLRRFAHWDGIRAQDSLLLAVIGPRSL